MFDTWMLDALGEMSGKTVIDIGCGDGRFSRILAGLGATVTGLDLTEPLIKGTRESAVGSDTYLLGNAEDLGDINDENFELAVSYIVYRPGRRTGLSCLC